MKAPAQSTDELVRLVAREALRPCAFQPRKTFNEQKLSELGLNLRENGVINPLIARRVAHGTDGTYRTNGTDDDGSVLEIVCGECRWRSSAARAHPVTGVMMAAMVELPILVRQMSDAQALELMLSENMQRNDLSPLEECDAFAMALEQRGGDGKGLHTLESLAERIGVTRQLIQDRLALQKLPKEGREALIAGLHSYRVLREVCRSPRSLVPKVLDVVLNPKKFPINRMAEYGAPLSAEDVRALANSLSAMLGDAPFDLADAGLVPLKTDDSGEQLEGGACTKCVFNSVNQVVVVDGGVAPVVKSGRPSGAESPRCFNAACYKKKVEVHVQSALVKAKQEGAILLKESEAERVLKGGPNGARALDYVELAAKLEEHERAPGVTDRQAPTWGEIVSDGAGRMLVTVFIAVDSRGRVRRFAERPAATAAAEKTGQAKWLSLEAGRGTSLQMAEVTQSRHMSEEEKQLVKDNQEEQRKAREDELSAQKLRTLTNRRTMGALVAAVLEQGVPGDAWPHFLAIAVTHAGNDGCTYVCKRREWEAKPGPDEAVEKYGAKLTGSEQMGLIVELLFAQQFSWALAPNATFTVPDSARGLFKYYGVDARKIEGAARDSLRSQHSTSNVQRPTSKEKKVPKRRMKRKAGKK